MSRFTEAELDALLREHNAFQWVMIEHWFEVGEHVVVDDEGQPFAWDEAKRRAAERNREWALDEAVRHAKKSRAPRPGQACTPGDIHQTPEPGVLEGVLETPG